MYQRGVKDYYYNSNPIYYVNSEVIVVSYLLFKICYDFKLANVTEC